MVERATAGGAAVRAPALRRLALVLSTALVLFACGSADEVARENALRAEPLGNQEDAVCGMIVRERSAPRGQVVHRDGARLFFCSIGDMLVHLGAPSPHGRVEAVFVEVMDPAEDPRQSHTGEHPWIPAEQAIFVVGIAREGIMGEPVLVYASREDAERVARGHPAAQLLDFEGLRSWWSALEAG